MPNTKQIILIAGPSACGKSTLQQQIEEGRCPALCRQLNIADPATWFYTSVRDVIQYNQFEQHSQLVIHCDLYNRATLKRLRALISDRHPIRSLTLITSQQTLLARNSRRIRGELTNLFTPRTFHESTRKIRGQKTRQKWNKDTETLRSTYQRWFDLLDEYSIPSFWIDSTAIDNPIAHPLSGNREIALKNLQPNPPLPGIGKTSRTLFNLWKPRGPAPDTICVLPWRHLHVQETGRIKLCCAAKNSHPLGHAYTDSLIELFDSPQMKRVRKDMFDGTIPSECKACFKNERTGSVSLRQFYNESYSSLVAQIRNGKMEPELRALDLRISNACNLKCRSCSAASSSAWFGDQQSLYPDRPVTPLISLEDSGPFKTQLTALLDRGLDELHLAGGEPLITDFNYRILDRLIEMRQTATALYYDTNLNTLTHNGRNILELWKHFDRLHISLSLDATGKQGEYIRHGLDFEKWQTNLRRLKETVPHASLRLHMVVSVFNIASLPRHLEHICSEPFVEQNQIGFTFLSGPPHLCVQIFPRHLKKRFAHTLHREIASNPAYCPSLRTAAKNLIRFMKACDRTEELDEFRRVTALLDQRRNEDAWELFPELRDILSAPESR
jgi:MoaA/NifB/PqqE/SkfB family radical SAM enzyme